MDAYINIYKDIYEGQKRVALQKEKIRLPEILLKPNHMQASFSECLERSYEIGKNGNGDRRGLLISATGTGKIYASAFGVRKIKPKKVLFLAHRTQLLSQAIKAYQSVFPSEKKYALVTG